MVKKNSSPKAKFDLKVASLRRTISSLETEIPLEGKKWQRKMIAHYNRLHDELLEANNGPRGS